MRGNEWAETRPGRPGALDAAVALAVAAAAALWDTSFHVVPGDGGSWRGVSAAPSTLRLALSLAFGSCAAWGLSPWHSVVRPRTVGFQELAYGAATTGLLAFGFLG